MRIKIVLDAMGSDNRPQPEIEASVQCAENLGVAIILVGDENVLKPLLAAQPGDKSHVSIVHAPEALEMSDHIQEARAKKNNTMQVGMNLVRSGEAQAFVTAGNTGMAMYFATKTFGLIPGVIRPCLCAAFPVKNGKCVILDIGANAECRPEFLVQFARMGSVYASLLFNRANPRVGLLANGEEEGKGNELVKAAGPLMRAEVPGFVGNIEGKELFAGEVDVAVTDGFTGNILLKSTEAVARLILETLKEELMRSTRTKLGALLAKPAFKSVRQMLDPSEVGAAPLLGINALVFVGHGRSDAKAVFSAVKQAKITVESGLLDSLRQSIPLNSNGETLS
ncbi:MAG: phosphate acyltransferase PlsX [Chloroflexi bacterium]|jgi:glycerol-3-phosphate acyltransferase PlsX|nr:phosphate acyltransferase PlsX [Anaerolineaceae bacterium]NLI45203.1 phosphate acyltransferase PlsX [Chloroflexota bacterium]HOE34730.1 phosphate acyltransferase PlsX [Anaerolineaceae bacterium]HOT25364.1 phosphate acyltransferase PlsX [Anaerolineaceae bacterium]HQH57329.1 phosphate acyltransferase PlsX [Anaerolineaceae bacterium]